MEGQILGNRYELIERVGGGGMAIVYKAKCKLLNRFVAVKILRNEFVNDEEFVKRFRIEAQAAASLSHPNIVSIFDVGHENNIHYIVMEYIDGITLKDYIDKKNALLWKEAVSIAIQICSAIDHAHKNHIVHRDIKPHNILLTREGIAKVTDFGIARAVSSSTITMVGSTIGSVHYFSPEQARGGFTDEKSDLYSLGITIYEMVTGKVPFNGETPVAVALKHIQTKAERPVDINPEVPSGINDIIMKAIKKDQNMRYQSASELLADLQRVLREPDGIYADEKNSMEEYPTKKLQAVGNGDYERSDEMVNQKDKQPKGQKKDRLSIWLGIVTAVIIVSIFFYIGFRIVIPAIMPDNSGNYIVKDYVNRDFTEVQSDLKLSEIEAVEEKRVFSDTVEKDIIISQSVSPDKILKPGSIIKFEVSDGPELVTIPDISGKESRIGDQMLKDFELQTSIVTEYNETIATGLVVRTEPGANEQVKPGASITIVESLGPELKQVKVPNLVGLTRTQAESLLNENNLKIGRITPEDVVSDVAKITKQYPLADSQVDEGTSVEMTFDITGTVLPGTEGQGTVGNSTGDTGNSDVNTASWKIPLGNPDNYGDEISVYVEATPSDTNVLNIIVNNEKVKKDQFPITVKIPLSKNGTTHVIVKLDGILSQENDY